MGSDDIELSVLPGVGARIHRLVAFGRDVLRTPADTRLHEHEPFFWGAYVMAPWGGRIDARPTDVAGRSVAVPANFRDGTAIHGQVYASPWEVSGPAELRAGGGGNGWPWRYEVHASYAVVGRSVRIEQTVVNRDDSAMPAGVGLHPWFRRPVEVSINAELVYDTNSDSPAAPRSVSGRWDAREPRTLSDGVDATWARLSPIPVRLAWPSLGIGGTMRMSGRTTFAVAATPPELDAVAVEPQTHAPQGLRRLINDEPGALALLEPGGSISLTTELTFATLQEDFQ
jgi:aldose 1-epimerase